MKATIPHSVRPCARRKAQQSAGPIAAVIVLMMFAPLAWSLSTLDTAYAGTANDAYAGPPASALATVVAKPATDYGIGLDSNRVTPSTRRGEAVIYRYAVNHSANSRFALVTDTWLSAAPLVMSGGTGVLPVKDAPLTLKLRVQPVFDSLSPRSKSLLSA